VNSQLPLLTIQERRQLGRDERHRLSRDAHAAWITSPDRLDVVTRLQEADRSRIAALLPLRYSRMQADAFAFLRGAAAIMAADLGGIASTTLRVQACGDAHLMNFGAHLSPESTPVFDVNDFDETLPAPFEWDVKRLAASLVVAARTRDMPERAARALARRAARAYRLEIAEFAQLPPLAAWRSRIDLERAIEGIGVRDVRRHERQRLLEVTNTGVDPWHGLIDRSGTALRLPERPPAVFRLGAEEPVAHGAFAAYEDSLAPEQRVLMKRYQLRDVAFKAVGVGSVGTFCAIGLFATADGDTLVLQLKEARRSVLAPYAGDSLFDNQGQRVVVGQRMMQASADVFLGWARDAPDGRHFYVRQLKDAHLQAVGAAIEGDALRFYAQLCGRTLARAHARAADSARIAGYLGGSESFDVALAEFACAYADQTEQDWRVFCDAIRSGRVEAKPEA